MQLSYNPIPKVKISLTPDEKRFLELYAINNDLHGSAKQAFQSVKRPDRKALTLLEKEIAKSYLKDRRAEALREAKEKFQHSVKEHYNRLLAQAEGTETTKEKVKEVWDQEAGLIKELKEKEYDKLTATKTILTALGELKENSTDININQANQNNIVVELD